MQWVRNHFSDERDRERVHRQYLQREVERLANVNTNMQNQLNTLEDRINRMTQRAGPYDEANPPPRPRRVLPATFGGLRGGAQIFVKTLSGKTIAVNDINMTDNAGELARNVCRRLGLPPDADFYFVFGGHVMRDENFHLWQYNVRSGNTVFMIMRLRGGGKSDPFCKKHHQHQSFRIDLVLIILSKFTAC